MNDKKAFAGKCLTRCNGKIVMEVGCSLIGATAHHPWLQDLESHIEEQDPISHLSLAFPYLTKITARHPEVHLFETSVFYPIGWDEARHTIYKNPVPCSTYAIHRWSSNWFENGLKPLNRQKTIS